MILRGGLGGQLEAQAQLAGAQQHWQHDFLLGQFYFLHAIEQPRAPVAGFQALAGRGCAQRVRQLHAQGLEQFSAFAVRPARFEDGAGHRSGHVGPAGGNGGLGRGAEATVECMANLEKVALVGQAQAVTAHNLANECVKRLRPLAGRGMGGRAGGHRMQHGSVVQRA